jgi:tetratricopeptide (TPR) repeat protein
VILRIVRQNYGRLRMCYERRLLTNPELEMHFVLRFVIGADGSVSRVSTTPEPSDAAVQCMIQSFRSVTFPAPEGGPVSVTLPLRFQPNGGSSAAPDEADTTPPVETPSEANPYDGKFADVMAALALKDVPSATASAQAWHAADPGDVLALVALGEVYTAARDVDRAARAYGSIIDLFPARADMRRFAGVRLEGLSTAKSDALAVDSYAKALQQRPDHPSSHRLYAWALFRSGKLQQAFDAAVHATKLSFAEDRFPAVARILREDVGLLAAAWAKAEPKRTGEIRTRAQAAEAKVESAPSLRFVLTWETDANDVDFHIYDSAGGHAYYGSPHLRSGGDLYADVTTGYGPECFTIRLPKQRRAKTYTLQANYYSRGPMGYGMGKLQVIEHDGHGKIRLEEHPYVVMKDQAFVNLGVIQR